MMKRARTLLFLLSFPLSTVSPLFSPTPASAAEPIRAIREEIPVGSAASVQLKTKAGDMIVEGWSEPTVGVDVRIGCAVGTEVETCRKASEDVRLAWARERDQLVVRVRGTTGLHARHLWIEVRFKVPASLPLELESVTGNMKVTNHRSDLEADAGSGDVEIVQKKADVQSVEIDVGAGRSDLWIGGGKVEGSGLFRGVNWSGGEGKAKIEVDIGAGNATVRLE